MNRKDTDMLAVFIDADNVSARHAERIFDKIANLGEAALRRCYGDFTKPTLASWNKHHETLGLVPRHQPAVTATKNSSDIAMVIEAMDMLHSGRFDGFVIVSSDSDFTRLVSRIHEEGLAVYVIGEQRTPNPLRQACKKFILLEDEDGSGKDAKKAASDNAQLSRIRSLVYSILDESEDSDGWTSLSLIGSTLKQRYPDFNQSNFGHKKLVDFVRHICNKKLEERHGESQLYFRRGKAS